ISDFTMGVMASPFYVDLGYTGTTVGYVQGLLGPWPIIVGGFVGGFVAVRYSLMPALLAGAVLTLLTNGAFAGLALAAGPNLDIVANAVSNGVELPSDVTVKTPPVWGLISVIVADNLAAGYVGSVFIAYMSSLTDRQFAATQYALLSSAYSFFCKLAATTTSGPLSEAIGWAGFFSVTALYTLPPAILILIVMRYGPDNAKGIRPDD
ncbi:MAG: MFS transporter, partial [Hyphomonas sp.]|nr:MFS transporter [Hyphomonas sp.]